MISLVVFFKTPLLKEQFLTYTTTKHSMFHAASYLNGISMIEMALYERPREIAVKLASSATYYYRFNLINTTEIITNSRQ